MAKKKNKKLHEKRRREKKQRRDKRVKSRQRNRPYKKHTGGPVVADLNTALKDREALVADIREIQVQYYEYRKDLVEDMQQMLKDAGIFDQFQEIETEIEESKQAAQKKLDGMLEELKTLEKVISYLQKDESITTEEEAPEEEAPEEEPSEEEASEEEASEEEASDEEPSEEDEVSEDEDCEDEDCDAKPAPKIEAKEAPAKPKRKRPKF